VNPENKKKPSNLIQDENKLWKLVREIGGLIKSTEMKC